MGASSAGPSFVWNTSSKNISSPESVVMCAITSRKYRFQRWFAGLGPWTANAVAASGSYSP